MAPGLHALFDDTAGLSQELLFAAAANGALLDVNPAWSRVLGWSESELRSKTLHDLVHPDDAEKWREAAKHASEAASELTYTARCQRKDGSYRRVSWTIKARENVLLGAGHVVAANENAQVVHDINNLMQTIVGALELVRMMHRNGRMGETDKLMTSAIASAHRAAELNQHRASAAPPASPAPTPAARTSEGKE